MRKVKEPDYDVFSDDEALADDPLADDEFTDSSMDYEDEEEDSSLTGRERVKRTWRDTERYLEMRELYKIINDELYTGLYTEDIFDKQDYDY